MDYEKKYKEALEKARQLCAYPTSKPFISDLQDLFPELKGSEDERIRKAIHIYLDWLDDRKEYAPKGEYTIKDMIAWLEKQGKKKSIWHNEDEEPQRGSLILLIMQSGNPIVAKIIEPNHTFNHGERWAYIDDLLDKQGEQKPAWSEEDKKELGRVIYMMEQLDLTESWSDCYTFLNSLKDRVQPKQEWSEEDESILQGIWDEILANKHDAEECEWKTYDKFLNWLKSLRPQSTWKPSDEQMEALSNAGNSFRPFEEGHKVLWSLYNDLKKLRDK